ncbi:type II toxin-antitoxin system HicA family toxin [Methanocalculus sp.]|uniref:type II toxin-antitoxin system HicA family toxin n=1 Tax=Methanocalculus sp. TaxID=2004547 RepID=UPI00260BF766|nr:type II toxin-antitoxin system HicA family toxin [Methanocalculus sp.]MDG6250861.1 type II toxin-antitoxin system HicA family toxin [Methanocalculus sp.]
MPQSPVVRGHVLLKIRGSPGYIVLRQWGSHVQMAKNTGTGEGTITIPLHNEIARGTPNNILGKVSHRNGISKEDLLAMLR